MISATGYGQVISPPHCLGRCPLRGPHRRLSLEGGYDLDGGSACATATIAALLNQPFTNPVGPSPWKEKGDWRAVVEHSKGLWGLE